MKYRGVILQKTIIILSIICLVLPNLGFAQQKTIEPPETLGEAKEMGEKFAEEAKEKMPGILGKIWKEDVIPVWKTMWEWTESWWQETVWPWFSSFFKEKVKPSLEEEIEKRKSIIKTEFQKEKEELKKETPKVGESLWERFKEIIKE